MIDGTEVPHQIDSVLEKLVAGGLNPGRAEAVEKLIGRLTLSQRQSLVRFFETEVPTRLSTGVVENFDRLYAALAKAAKTKDSDEFVYLVDVLSREDLLRNYGEKVLRRAWSRIKNSKDPYTTDSSLSQKDLFEFEKLAKSTGSSSSEIKKWNAWLQTPTHALYLYQNLSDLGHRADGVLARLISENKYFARVGRIRGPPETLMTYAFEKETRKTEATMMYKDPAMTDEQWLELSDQDRADRLSKLVFLPKKAMPASKIAPTALKPEVLGGLSEESLKPKLYEFTHRNYEMDPARLVAHMEEVSKLLKEGDFHVHLVFDLPENYGDMVAFSTWMKQLNDYLYFAGMEEGLHGSSLVQIAEPPRDPKSPRGFLERVTSLLPEVGVGKGDHLPNRLGSVGNRNYKFFSASVRAGIYGKSKSPHFQKIGIELRDVTREIKNWEPLVEKIGKSARARTWEGRIFSQKASPDEILLSGKMGENERVSLLHAGFKPDFLAALEAAEPMSAIPLRNFETARFKDYVASGYRKASPEQAARIASAREGYFKNLRDLEREWNGYLQKGEKVAPEELSGAIRISLTEWAIQAKVSELYSGF